MTLMRERLGALEALARARRVDEAREKRVPVARVRPELGVELRAEEPRVHVRRQLDELDEPSFE